MYIYIYMCIYMSSVASARRRRSPRAYAKDKGNDEKTRVTTRDHAGPREATGREAGGGSGRQREATGGNGRQREATGSNGRQQRPVPRTYFGPVPIKIRQPQSKISPPKATTPLHELNIYIYIYVYIYIG